MTFQANGSISNPLMINPALNTAFFANLLNKSQAVTVVMRVYVPPSALGQTSSVMKWGRNPAIAGTGC